LHYGLYGHRASLMTLRKDLDEFRESDTGVGKLLPTLNQELNAWEDINLNRQGGFLSALCQAALIGLTTRIRNWRLRQRVKTLVESAATTSPTVSDHQGRLISNANRYLYRRIELLRKFAQYRACERLFSLWHIVHYPLFLLLVLAAIVHVIAVHMY